MDYFENHAIKRKGKSMNNGTCIMLVLFYTFRHYKRVGLIVKKNELLSDLKKCHVILKRMEENINPDISTKFTIDLIHRLNRNGSNLELQKPLRYADGYDFEIIMLMSRLTKEIIYFVKRPFYKKYSDEIFTRLLVLHNLPRVLLKDSSGDESTGSKIHISKQEALEYVASMHLGDAPKPN